MAEEGKMSEKPEAEDRDFKTTKYDETDLLPVRSRISWGPLFAGAVAALATFLLLSALGTAIGLSVNDAGPDDDLSTGAVIWAIASTLVALFFGGWISTRLTAGENMTEGLLSGVLVWGLVFGILLTLAAQGVATGFNAMLEVNNGAVAGQGGLEADQVTQPVSERWDPATAKRVAWYTFAGMLLSIATACAGAALGAGPSPRFRAWVVEPRRRRYPVSRA